MKNLFFLFSIVTTLFLFSCVERAPAVKNAPVHSAPRTASPGGAVASGNATGDFTFVRNPVQGFTANLGLAPEQAKQLHELRNGFVVQMAATPKLANGKFNMDKVKPIMDKMNGEIKRFLGPQKFKRYQKYNVWFNQQLAARQ